ncbi:unnamed protein product [Rotaria magnacalcarata]|uniref:Platelet-derived growth factor (PDGF) family profile domain-containing protein n=1 Tax=Rotaria magnacalcarata TaxID=392030 RepID=A0A816KPV8_9BILA|nr:unnamed protein product [Rotaria magnacalcarata]
MYLFKVVVLILLSNSINADENKHKQAELRARLSQAKSIQEALVILKSSGNKGGLALISPDSLKKEQETIREAARMLRTDMHSSIEPRNGGCEPRVLCEEVPVDHMHSSIEPRNGGCEPRVLCEEVPVDRTIGNNVISYPQCLEIHRCGGCCQEAQFSCIPIQEDPVTFSPLLLISLDDTNQYEVNRPLTLMNHTKCECKCSKKDDECQREGKILDSILCQCIQPRCSPECLISSTCSVVPGSSTPRCTCRRRIPGQSSNFCSNPSQRPNHMCTRCEAFYG